MELLIASLVFLGVGPVLYQVAGLRPKVLAVIDAMVVLSVGGLVLFHIVPHSIEAVGWVAMVPLMLGLLVPTVAENYLKRMASHTHSVVIGLVVVGLGVHSAIDGIALGAPGASSHGVHGAQAQAEHLPLAVALHRIPAGLLVWRLLYKDMGPRIPFAILTLIAGTTIIGFMLAEVLLGLLPEVALALFNALVAGTLLHVVVDQAHMHARGHEHSQRSE